MPRDQPLLSLMPLKLVLGGSIKRVCVINNRMCRDRYLHSAFILYVDIHTVFHGFRREVAGDVGNGWAWYQMIEHGSDGMSGTYDFP